MQMSDLLNIPNIFSKKRQFSLTVGFRLQVKDLTEFKNYHRWMLVTSKYEGTL